VPIRSESEDVGDEDDLIDSNIGEVHSSQVRVADENSDFMEFYTDDLEEPEVKEQMDIHFNSN